MKNIVILLLLILRLPTISVGQTIPLCHENLVAVLGKMPGAQEFDEIRENCDPSANKIAIRQIDSLAKLTGFPLKFKICKAEKIQNAYAAMDTLGNRSIVYDDDFLKSLDSDSLRWESLTTLAHEIGHHLAAHTLYIIDENYLAERAFFCDTRSANYDLKKCKDTHAAYLRGRREEELEADRIAGFIMFRYGATIDQISNLYSIIAWNKDDSHDDHPSLQKRIGAATAGYQLGAQKGPGTKVSIEELRGTKYDFVVQRMDVIERNRLRDKVKKTIYFTPLQKISENPKFRCATSGFGFGERIHQRITNYLGGEEIAHNNINNDSVYFDLHTEEYYLQDDRRVKFGLVIGIYIKNDTLKIIHFKEEGIKVIYKSYFSENEISFDEITMILTDMYRNGLQKEINRIYNQ